MNHYSVSITTPIGESFLEEGVSYLLAPAVKGTMGVLPHHASIIAALISGELTIKKSDNTEKHYAIGDGVLEVLPNHDVVILTSEAKAMIKEPV